MLATKRFFTVKAHKGVAEKGWPGTVDFFKWGEGKGPFEA